MREHPSVFEFDYDGATYRFAEPDLLQNSFHSIRKNGVFYERQVLEDMRQRLTAGELVIDVGAHIGNHAVFLAGVCRCDVIALEPYPKTFEVLARNLELNQLNQRVTAINLAAGAKPGYGRPSLPATANDGQISIRAADAETEIRIEPLDAIDLPRPPRMLKIDVEGGELDVLKGAERLIARSRPLIYIEALNEHAFEDMCQFLYNMNYRALKFFEPAMFLFMSMQDAGYASQDCATASQLARQCLRYHGEAKTARTRLSKSKDMWFKSMKKRIKGKARKPSEMRRS